MCDSVAYYSFNVDSHFESVDARHLADNSSEEPTTNCLRSILFIFMRIIGYLTCLGGAFVERVQRTWSYDSIGRESDNEALAEEAQYEEALAEEAQYEEALAEEAQYEEALANWIREVPADLEGPEQQSLILLKQCAAEEIRKFLNDPVATELNLYFENKEERVKIDSFPPIFHPAVVQIFANRLITLTIRNTCIKSVPPDISHLQSLKALILTNNELQDLPEEIGYLALRYLGVGYNHLKSLPDIISQRQWDFLDLSNNPLHVMPLHPFYLESSIDEENNGRVILLRNTEIPFALRTILQKRMELDDYEGPTIILPAPEKRPHGAPEPRLLCDSLKDLFFLAEAPPEGFTKLLEDEEWAGNLTTWLTRISDILKEKIGGTGDSLFSTEKKSVFCKKILKYMQLAERDPQFRALFFTCISEGIETCGDRAILSILRMGLFHQLSTIDRNNLQILADFLIRGPWATKQLEMVAEEKVVSLRKEREDQGEEFIEEVQVYLAYPILLREKLSLFLDVDEMLYCSDVTEEDLQVAESYVNGLLIGRDARYEILSKDKIWRSSLKEKYPQEYAALVAAKKEAIEASEDPDYVAIGDRFMQGIRELTRLALKAEEGSFDADLEEWAEGILEENRQRAINKIRMFLTNPDANSLDLSNLGVPMPLPIFHPEVQEIFASRLKGLNLEGNHIEGLPGIHNLQALKWLRLGNNELRELPPEICQLQNLTVLDVHNNRLHDLPKEICQLQDLVALHIEQNEFETLPQGIDQLPALTALLLSNNQLRSLPSTIGQWQMLEILDLSSNRLATLPKEFSNLRVRTLYLYDNPLDELSFMPFDLSPWEEEDETECINLENTFIPLPIQNQLRAIYDSPGYAGPKISFSE